MVWPLLIMFLGLFRLFAVVSETHLSKVVVVNLCMCELPHPSNPMLCSQPTPLRGCVTHHHLPCTRFRSPKVPRVLRMLEQDGNRPDIHTYIALAAIYHRVARVQYPRHVADMWRACGGHDSALSHVDEKNPVLPLPPPPITAPHLVVCMRCSMLCADCRAFGRRRDPIGTSGAAPDRQLDAGDAAGRHGSRPRARPE